MGGGPRVKAEISSRGGSSRKNIFLERKDMGTPVIFDALSIPHSEIVRLDGDHGGNCFCTT